MNSKILAVLGLVGLSLVPTVAMAEDVFGQSDAAVQASLAQRGIKTQAVEAWGDYIRAWVVNADGTVTQRLFNADNYAPVKAS